MSRRLGTAAIVGALACGLLAGPTPARGVDVPSNGWIVWASTRQDGRREIYRIPATGSDPADVVRLTYGGGDFATWSPDGSWIAYHHTGEDSVHVMRPDASGDRRLTSGFAFFWMHDGSGLACSSGDQYAGAGNDLRLWDVDAGTSSLLVRRNDFAQMVNQKWVPGGITRDGRWLVTYTQRFNSGYTCDNGWFEQVNTAAVLDLQDKSKLYMFNGGCEPTTPPAGDWIYHMGGNWPDTAPVKMRTSEITMSPGSRTTYQFEVDFLNADWGHEYTPRISNDNVWMVYMSSTGDHSHDTADYEIFVHRLGAGLLTRTRITYNTANDRWPHMYVGSLWQPPANPALSLDPVSLAFVAVVGGSPPPSQTVDVTNAGTGTLDNVGTSVSYGAGSGWLSVVRSGSGNSQGLTNSVAASGLSAGVYTATVQVSCGNAANSPQSYEVTLDVVESTVFDLPGRVEVEDYRLGVEGVAYHDTTAGNAGGEYRADDVDIEASGDTGGGYSIGWVAAGEWLTYDVNVAQAGTYVMTARVACVADGRSLHVEIDGGTVATFSFDATGGWQSWTDVTVTDVDLAAGSHLLKVVFDTENVNLNYIDVTSDGGPSITIVSPAGGEVWYVGSTEHIRWTTVGVDDVVLNYSTDDGASWMIVNCVDVTMPEWGDYPWVVPNEPSTACFVQIEGYMGEAPTMSGAFEIRPPGADADSDGLPDAWEETHFGSTAACDPAADPDGDGLTNAEEYSAGTDPNNQDTDGDQMPDGWEVTNGTDPTAADGGADGDGDGLTNLEEFTAGTDPTKSDTDGDQMPDGWEVKNGTDPTNADAGADPDGDGFSNLEEYQAGSDPTDAASTPDTVGKGGTGFGCGSPWGGGGGGGWGGAVALGALALLALLCRHRIPEV